MKTLFTLLALSCLAGAQDSAKFITDTLYPATALLYSEEADGAMKMRCTATAIGHHGDTYTFVTAAHCGCEDDTDHKTVSPEKTFFYVTQDGAANKEFERGKVTGCGFRHKGDDFMLLEVVSKKNYPVVPLGDDPKILDPVINVASPLGLGKQVFSGTVSAVSLDRPVIEDDINWTGVVLLQMFGVNGGSSGSSVVCLDQKAICAFVVGAIGNTSITAMPVSRLKSLQKALADHSYKQWREDADATDK